MTGKWVISPAGERPMINPLKYAARPHANCCTDVFMLIKPPRYLGSTEDVIIAIAGTPRPDMQTMNNVETASAAASGTRGKLVNNRIGTAAASDINVNTRRFPARSAQRPIQFMLTKVQIPPVR